MFRYFAALVAVFLWVTPANAAQQCGTHDAVAEALGEDPYNEQVAGVGVNNQSQYMIELYVSPETGSWTIVQTQPNGTSCIRAHGENFDLIPLVIGDPA